MSATTINFITPKVNAGRQQILDGVRNGTGRVWRSAATGVMKTAINVVDAAQALKATYQNDPKRQARLERAAEHAETRAEILQQLDQHGLPHDVLKGRHRRRMRDDALQRAEAARLQEIANGTATPKNELVAAHTQLQQEVAARNLAIQNARAEVLSGLRQQYQARVTEFTNARTEQETAHKAIMAGYGRWQLISRWKQNRHHNRTMKRLKKGFNKDARSIEKQAQGPRLWLTVRAYKQGHKQQRARAQEAYRQYTRTRLDTIKAVERQATATYNERREQIKQNGKRYAEAGRAYAIAGRAKLGNTWMARANGIRAVASALVSAHRRKQAPAAATTRQGSEPQFEPHQPAPTPAAATPPSAPAQRPAEYNVGWTLYISGNAVGGQPLEVEKFREAMGRADERAWQKMFAEAIAESQTNTDLSEPATTTQPAAASSATGEAVGNDPRVLRERQKNASLEGANGLHTKNLPQNAPSGPGSAKFRGLNM